MRVRLLRDAEGPNPEFNAEAKIAAEARGEIYPHHHTMILPAGTVIDHPQAHYHCRPGFRNTPPLAEPIDEAAKQKTAQYLASRKIRLRQLKAVVDAHVGEDAQPLPNKAAQANLEQLAADYHLQPGVPLPDETATPETDPIDDAA